MAYQDTILEPVKDERKRRTCLRCDSVFLWKSPGNRLCKRCREAAQRDPTPAQRGTCGMQAMGEVLAEIFPEAKAWYGRCGRKLAYPSIDRALTVKARREQRAGISLHLYHCEFNDHWHLSSHEPTAAQRQRMIDEAMAVVRGMEAERGVTQ